jgi:hypothetical protein
MKLNTVAAKSGYRWETAGTSNPLLGSEYCMRTDTNMPNEKNIYIFNFLGRL